MVLTATPPTLNHFSFLLLRLWHLHFLPGARNTCWQSPGLASSTFSVTPASCRSTGNRANPRCRLPVPSFHQHNSAKIRGRHRMSEMARSHRATDPQPVRPVRLPGARFIRCVRIAVTLQNQGACGGITALRQCQRLTLSPLITGAGNRPASDGQPPAVPAATLPARDNVCHGPGGGMQQAGGGHTPGSRTARRRSRSTISGQNAPVKCECRHHRYR